MSCEDWRTATADEIAPLLAGERARWMSALAWDTTTTWGIVEDGRRAGRLPGFIERAPDDHISGWCFFTVDRGSVHLGAIDGERADVVRDLLDQVLDAPEVAYARRFQAFLYPRNPAVGVALQRRRFQLTPQLLLSRAIDPQRAEVEPGSAGRRWRPDDLAGVVRLLARAYAGSPVSDAFAPEGRLEEWVNYVGQVINTSACGTFLPEASLVIAGEAPDRPAGVILTTAISPGVWHVAQVATDPAQRRKGLGRQLVQHVCDRARVAGVHGVTLVVDERNEVARSLYAALGFEQRGTLLLASRGRVTRMVNRVAEPAAVNS